MRKETQVLNENTTMTIEHTKGRCDIEITSNIKGVVVSEGVIEILEKPHEEKIFYWIEFDKTDWIIRLCVNGFCYNSVEIGRTYTKKEAIQTVIDRHTSQHCYDFGLYGEWFTTEFEAQLISKVIADYYQEDFEYIREYDGQHIKAYPNGYVFECDDIEVPENTIKSEEEAAAEHFVKQMSEPETDVNTMIIKQNLNSYYGMTVNQKSEYMGTEYMDARRLNNWKDLLIEKKYGMVREHDKIYCVTSYGKVFGWFWNVKGAQQFQGLYGGDIGLVDSDLFFIDQIHDKFLDVICTVEIDELSIESQLIYAGYLRNMENRPAYIFACLQSYTHCFELDMMVREMNMQQAELSIQKFLKCTYRDLANNKDYEKSLIAFCKDILYLTEQIIAFKISEKEGE